MKRITQDQQTQTYVVKAYDCLSAIARKLTGSTDYSTIYAQNKDAIGENPNNLSVGMVLTIPRGSGGLNDDD